MNDTTRESTLENMMRMMTEMKQPMDVMNQTNQQKINEMK